MRKIWEVDVDDVGNIVLYAPGGIKIVMDCDEATMVADMLLDTVREIEEGEDEPF